jgi:hypothetical protein
MPERMAEPFYRSWEGGCGKRGRGNDGEVRQVEKDPSGPNPLKKYKTAARNPLKKYKSKVDTV